MKLVRRLVLLVLATVLLAATAYGVGHAGRPADHRSTTTASSPSGRAPVAEPTAAPAAQQPAAAHSPAPAPTPARTPQPTPEPTREPSPTPTPTPTPEPEPELQPGPALLAPGASGSEVRDLQARLKQLAWFSAEVTGYYGDVTAEAVRGFQAKREMPVTGAVDERTQDRLRVMTTEPTPAELTGQGNVAGPLDARCATGSVLCVDKSTSTLRWVVDGQVRQTLDVRFGASYSPTREGLFHVERKSRDHVSTLYGSEMPFAMFFSGGQAVHYSSDFAARGYAGASHGCVNVRDREGLAQLFDQVQVGDAVVVYWS